jgi:hypothetical protein
VSKGVFWRIAGNEKERYNSLKLLLLAITAGSAQLEGMQVHSIGMIYPLEGRFMKLRLPDHWPTWVSQILQRINRI